MHGNPADSAEWARRRVSMALSILNNISALTAENNLTTTQASLQKTLTQLSSGSKINSGSDDAAGLSIANGLAANIAALTQSVQNATNGTGLLQTADGALSQVTTLLNRAVTLATEGSSGGITTGDGSQAAALNTEYQSILSEITNIGSTTNFNGQNVFASNNVQSYSSTQASLSSATTLSAGDKFTITDSKGGTFVYTAQAGDTLDTLASDLTAASTAGTLDNVSASYSGGKLVISSSDATDSIQVTSTSSATGTMTATAPTADTATVYISDGGSGHSNITTNINTLSASGLGLTGDLSSTADAQTSLAAITTAIQTIASQRGVIGASVNQLQAASNVMNSQMQNLTSAQSGITDADVGQTVANMSKYNTLEQTGIAALQQANQASQTVLKLLQ